MNPMTKKNTILIVEDAIDIQKLLQLLCETAGYEVTCASNGREALEQLRGSETLPSVILLDLLMPVMNGYEFLKEVKKDTKLSPIPVIVMSAQTFGEDVKQPDLAGSVFLRKPLDIDLVLDTLATAVT